jgi:CRISPR-associated protein (TIGR03984 family)
MPELQTKTLAEAIADFKPFLSASQPTYGILYTPTDCHLTLMNHEGKFFKQDKDVEFFPQRVFEARIFNERAELRWLNESDDKGKASVIADESFPDVQTIEQRYLFWGRSTGTTKGDWTQFATARIGSFYVPLPNVGKDAYAQIQAREYLAAYQDGNVAVVDERLVGIEEVK